MDLGTEPSSKVELLDLIADEHESLHEVFASLDASRLLAPELDGGRSPKDILAHLTGWEQRMLQWVEDSYAGRHPDRPAPDESWPDLDQVNEGIFRDARGDPLPQVLEEAAASHRQVLARLKTMTDADLFDGQRFAWRKGDPMWHLVAANTYLHYREHREQIESWIARSA